MKTYTAKIEKPRLVIQYDDSAESPREWDNLGYFITAERHYNCPDNNETIKNIVTETQHEASNTQEHADAIARSIKEQTGEKVLYITPVYRYEHGNVLYRRGTASGFDSSNCGFYIVTDKTADALTPSSRYETIIDNELETYTSYVNGEVYGFTLYDQNGDVVDSCWGFYDIDAIKQALPDEYKSDDMHDYLKN